MMFGVREPVCQFNRHVLCKEAISGNCSACQTCGWNPAVHNQRIKNWGIERRQNVGTVFGGIDVRKMYV